MEKANYRPEWQPGDAGREYACSVMPGVPLKSTINSDTIESFAKKTTALTAADYKDGILAGDRMILSKAITIIESNAAKHFDLGQEIIAEILPYTGKAMRVGITGVPGAGKSTFIEALGCSLCKAGHKIAVLAVDPSSSLSRGSILGDKTRMEQLSREKNAYIRPSPSGGSLGGVTRKSRETILLCEAAGYDTILVETVGVGQSETTVRSMVDFFLFVAITGAGDDLQGIKKGILEIADAILVNKADGDNKLKALAARADYDQILHYLRPATEGWTTHAYSCSSVSGEGIKEIWEVIEDYKKNVQASGVWQKRRQEQTLTWVKSMSDEYVHQKIELDKNLEQARSIIKEQLMQGKITPTNAARYIIDKMNEIIFRS